MKVLDIGHISYIVTFQLLLNCGQSTKILSFRIIGSSLALGQGQNDIPQPYPEVGLSSCRSYRIHQGTLCFSHVITKLTNVVSPMLSYTVPWANCELLQTGKSLWNKIPLKIQTFPSKTPFQICQITMLQHSIN